MDIRDKRKMRFPEVLELTNLSRSTIWRLEIANAFPRHHRLAYLLEPGRGAVGWSAYEISAWLDGTWRPDSIT